MKEFQEITREKMFERVKTLKELFAFLWHQKLWWLIPMLLVFLVIGLLVVFVGSSPLAPIVYPLF